MTCEALSNQTVSCTIASTNLKGARNRYLSNSLGMFALGFVVTSALSGFGEQLLGLNTVTLLADFLLIALTLAFLARLAVEGSRRAHFVQSANLVQSAVWRGPVRKPSLSGQAVHGRIGR